MILDKLSTVWAIFVAEEMGRFQKSGKLVGMDAIYHEHFHYKENAEK